MKDLTLVVILTIFFGVTPIMLLVITIRGIIRVFRWFRPAQLQPPLQSVYSQYRADGTIICDEADN